MPRWPNSILTPIYPSPAVNESITLYSGPLEYDFHKGPVPGAGRISHSWFPRSVLLFEFTETGASNAVGHSGGPLTIPGFSIPVAGHMFRAVGAEHFSFDGMIDDPLCSVAAAANVDHVLFHFANLPVFQHPIRTHWNSPVQPPPGRFILELPPWQLVVDPMPDSSDRDKALEAAGGYALTHVGRLEQVPSAPFTVGDVQAFGAVTQHFLSLAIGRWTQPALPVAFDAAGTEVWRSWHRIHTDRWDRPGSWLAWGREWTLRKMFPRFTHLWNDKIWGDSLRLAIYWYLGANSRETGTEAAIILQQVTLELLSWVTLVEDLKVDTRTSFEGRRAADNIRALLLAAGIPADIPADLTSLTPFAAKLGAQDGPELLTLIRNKFVHPTPTTPRKVVLAAATDELMESWLLGMWYLDLVFLWLLRHDGFYASRIKKGHEGVVPWASSPPPEEFDF